METEWELRLVGNAVAKTAAAQRFMRWPVLAVSSVQCPAAQWRVRCLQLPLSLAFPLSLSRSALSDGLEAFFL